MTDVTEPTLVLDGRCELGEGPVWRAADDALWFVDIKQRKIHRFRPTDGALTSWDAPDQTGFVLPAANGKWVAGLKTGLHAFDPASGEFRLIATIEDPALGNRLNDGSVDAHGRLWFGSMHDDEREPSGALYRYDARGLAKQDVGYCITNGPATSPDGRTFYHTDTVKKVVYAFDLSAEGELSDRRVLIRIEDGAGHPDGTAIDAEGCLWVALFGGWAARRYSPAGELLQTVRFPAGNVTKIAFGGPDLKTAYATTARKGLSPEDLAAQPQAGGLFSFVPPAPGQPTHEAGSWAWA